MVDDGRWRKKREKQENDWLGKSIIWGYWENLMALRVIGLYNMSMLEHIFS